MRFLARLAVVAFALGAAITAGFIFMVIAGLGEPAMHELIAGLGFAGFFALFDAIMSEGAPDAAALAIGAALWTMALMVLVLPPVVAAVVGEIGGWRSFVWYGGASGAISAAVPWAAGAGRAGEGELRITLLLFLTGTLSGLVYWLIAGRTAGVERGEPPA
ncbi:hypothetical protein GGR16_004208 [Chelatococcus caeni]|uniref:Uncharacterized protein n=1 Tax=Chelatococcus caeni TaxID=1348468 RepID=A0A840C028_9HYPH|nr:hypothetical protein [Chelatococcus caeni]MBB4019161.1 hypothetical protein [Chelatococcus caeni]